MGKNLCKPPFSMAFSKGFPHFPHGFPMDFPTGSGLECLEAAIGDLTKKHDSDSEVDMKYIYIYTVYYILYIIYYIYNMIYILYNIIYIYILYIIYYIIILYIIYIIYIYNQWIQLAS